MYFIILPLQLCILVFCPYSYVFYYFALTVMYISILPLQLCILVFCPYSYVF